MPLPACPVKNVQQALGIRQQAAEFSLAEFVRQAWHVIEPATPYIHGWHIDAICAHLEAVTDGRLNRLLINVPPGTMKSLLVSVFWPAWEWGPRNLPHLRYLTTSYSEKYAKRDARKMRDLIESDWYREHWGNRFELTRSGETSFANDANGNREAMPFSSLTGGRGDRVIIDDPHSTETAESVADRARTNRIFRESVPTRLNDPARSAIIVIMQRLHEDDVSGLIIKQELGYETVILPMEFEAERRCSTSIGFTDPRTTDGELLFPQRFDRKTVERDKRIMGSYATAGQFQQRPAPRGGGMFKRHWFDTVKAIPAGGGKRVRRWDFAATTPAPGQEPDWTVGVLMLKTADGFFYVLDVIRFRGSAFEVERAVENTANRDGHGVEIFVPQDPGQAGKGQAQGYIRRLAGFIIKSERESGSKEVRAQSFAAQCEAQNVKLLEGAWNGDFLAELEMFPSSAHDDQVDAAAGAFNALTLRSVSPVGKAKLSFGA